MLERESAVPARESSSHNLNRDVSSGATFRVSGGKHFALRGGFEIAMNLLIDGKSRNSFRRRGGEGFNSYCKGAASVMTYGWFLQLRGCQRRQCERKKRPSEQWYSGDYVCLQRAALQRREPDTSREKLGADVSKSNEGRPSGPRLGRAYDSGNSF